MLRELANEGGGLKLGISCGSPETAERGCESFGHFPAEAQTVPNQLGVDFNARILESIVKDITPALGD